MNDSYQFGQRNMNKLCFKVKLVVLYGSKEDRGSLDELRDKCKTSTCQYTLVPIYMELMRKPINVTNINKYMKNHISGYKKNLDRYCIIDPNMQQSDQYIIFDSINKFKKWFQQDLNQNNII